MGGLKSICCGDKDLGPVTYFNKIKKKAKFNSNSDKRKLIEEIKPIKEKKIEIKT